MKLQFPNTPLPNWMKKQIEKEQFDNLESFKKEIDDL